MADARVPRWLALAVAGLAVAIAVHGFQFATSLAWPSPKSVCVVSGPVAPAWTYDAANSAGLLAIALVATAVLLLLLARRGGRRG